MSEHSNIVGGSGASRYINCPGSVVLKEKAPPSESSEFARVGTILHFVIEQILLAEAGSKDADPLSWVGEVISTDEMDPETCAPYDVEITEEHITTKIMPALEWFDKHLDPDQFWCEQRVEFDGALKGAFGTGDVLYHNANFEEGEEENEAGCVDWKFGDGVLVQAEDNDQGRFYLAAAIKKHWFGKDFNRFHFYIVQPVAGRDSLYSHTVFTRDELQIFEQRLMAAHIKVQAGNTDLETGKWCKFCPAEVICPAWRDRAAEALADVPRETLKPGTKKQSQDPEFKHITYDHGLLRESYLIATLMSSWVDAVKKLVKKEFDEGRPVEGLKKVVYRKGKEWHDAEKAKNWVRRNGLKAADYNEPAEFKSVAKIMALMKDGDHPLNEKLWGELPGAYQYVALDDPRDAVGVGGDAQAAVDGLASALKGKNT